MGEPRMRHCWECLRRCLVCDRTQPTCKRCTVSGTQCPGYSDVKPTRLRWLAPGKVKSRAWKQKGCTPKSIEATNNDNNEASKNITNGTVMVSTFPDREVRNLAIPRFKMRTEADALTQAVAYYNSCIYQDMLPIQDLGPNPYIYLLSTGHLEAGAVFPRHVQLSLVCTTLSHRINRIQDGTRSHTELVETFYRYRGIIISALNEYISIEHKRISDITLAGIVTLLLIDAQQGSSSNWRCHLEGVQRLIALRGGLRTLATYKPLESLLLCFISISIFGNTTSPASDLIIPQCHFDDLELIMQSYGGAVFTFQMCPPPIFAEIIKVNYLRARAMQPDNHTMTRATCLTEEAYEILGRIDAANLDEWAESKPSSREDWLIAGNAYRAAAALYCVSSLQSQTVLPPNSATLKARGAVDARFLETVLAEALQSPKINRYVLWPLVVLGTEAVRSSPATRAFVRDQLARLSRFVGTHVPLAARAVLEKFWVSGGSRWDDCFDRPHAFVIQIAIDMSRMTP